MKAMILAAGRGTRMGALTQHTPKPLLRLAGLPLIEYHIRALASAGFSELVINVAWLGDQIIDAMGNGQRFGLNIEYSVEPEGALETAGGIARALPHLGSEPFAVVNGDIWTDYPMHLLHNALNSVMEDGPAAHLIMVPNPYHNPKGDFSFEPDADVKGVIQSGRLQPSEGDSLSADVASKNQCLSKLTFSGMGVYRPQLFASITGRRSLGPLLREWIDQQQVSACSFKGRWWDVGTPERLAQVEQFLRGDELA